MEANLISLPGNNVSENSEQHALYISADQFLQIFVLILSVKEITVHFCSSRKRSVSFPSTETVKPG